jgi:CopG antitoxin of type II toxin-antitoxin system
MSKRTTIHLPEDLLKRAKHKAAAEGRTLTSLIEEGMRLVLIKKRVTLPVSKATGGLLPGIDISDGSALQEMDDLEYVERMKHFK